uniref:Tc1-like transposase DDE domain-containing protein n=1 Tax=Paramormyrops kingsleyae TaxID=1676925 RepID=A0A3B3TC28_9TELE
NPLRGDWFQSPTERINPANVVERHAGIMVWGAIGYDFRSSLLVILGTLTAQRYVSDVLRLCVLPLLRQHPGTIFQQDNIHPHTARVATNCLRHVEVLPWPARSPDRSPIEHVWDQLRRQLRPSANLQDLKGHYNYNRCETVT